MQNRLNYSVIQISEQLPAFLNNFVQMYVFSTKRPFILCTVNQQSCVLAMYLTVLCLLPVFPPYSPSLPLSLSTVVSLEAVGEFVFPGEEICCGGERPTEVREDFTLFIVFYSSIFLLPTCSLSSCFSSTSFLKFSVKALLKCHQHFRLCMLSWT